MTGWYSIMHPKIYRYYKNIDTPRRVSRKPVAVNNKQTLQRKIERFNREYSKYLKYMPAPYREAPPHNGWIIYTDNKTTPYKK